MSNLSTPAMIEQTLQAIERDLHSRQPAYERAATTWTNLARDREREYAIEYTRATGSPWDRRQAATERTALIGKIEEAEYVGLKAAIKVMETRAMICMALLKSAGRA